MVDTRNKKSLSNEGNVKYGVYIDGIKEKSEDNKSIYKEVEHGGNDILSMKVSPEAKDFRI